MLKPITDKYFGTDEAFDLEHIYDEVFGLEDEQLESLKADVIEKFKVSQTTFGDAPEEDKEFLQTFSFICVLGFDVYVKKLLIEKLIDDLKNRKSKE